MTIIHTSDWHLGQNFYTYDREDEHRSFFEQLAVIIEARHPDALVVSGDVFHNAAPSAAARRLFVEGVMMLHDASPGTVIVITAGNHDSGSRLEAERELWLRLGIHVLGGCTRREDGTFDPEQFVVEVPGKGYVLAAPHFHPSNYPLASADTDREERQTGFFASLLGAVADKGKPVVLMAHLAVDGCNTRGHEDIPVGGMLKERLSDLGEGYDYLALGHIHMPQRISERARYCGSPVPVSFSEDYDHYVNLVEIGGHGETPEVEQLPLRPLRRVRTVPADGAPLEEALQALAGLDDADDSYVRVLIDQDEPIAPDAEDRARLIAGDKACRFCEIRRKPRMRKGATAPEMQVTEMSDFNQLDPLNIALSSYQRDNDSPMGTTLLKKMRQAIDETINDMQA